MKKKSAPKSELELIEKALNAFPKAVREQRRKYLAKKRFQEKTFGELSRQLLKLEKQK